MKGILEMVVNLIHRKIILKKNKERKKKASSRKNMMSSHYGRAMEM